MEDVFQNVSLCCTKMTVAVRAIKFFKNFQFEKLVSSTLQNFNVYFAQQKVQNILANLSCYTRNKNKNTRTFQRFLRHFINLLSFFSLSLFPEEIELNTLRSCDPHSVLRILLKFVQIRQLHGCTRVLYLALRFERQSGSL